MWQSSLNGTNWTNIANTTTSLAYSNLTANTQYRAVVQSGVCGVATSSAVNIAVTPASNGGVISGSPTVCYGSNGLLTVSGQTGSILRWEFSVDGGDNWSNIANTSATQSFSNLTTTTRYRVVVKNGVCDEAKSSLAITVNPTPAVGTPTAITVETGSTEPTCRLTVGSTTTGYATTASNNEGFNWSISNAAAGSINESTGVVTWAAGFSGTVLIRVTANGCNGPSPMVQRAVTLNPPFTPVITASPAAICIGQSATLTATDFNTANNNIAGGDFSNNDPSGWFGQLGNSSNNNTASPFPWGYVNKNKDVAGYVYNSNDNSSFMIVSGSLSSTLETPVFSSIGRTSLSLEWYQGYNFNSGTTGKVEISTDGGATYTTLDQYTGPAITSTDPFTTKKNLDLNSYLGQSNLRIRFNYVGTSGSTWAIDNVNLIGPFQPVTYQWSQAAGLTGTGQTVTVTPTATTTYSVTSTSGGCAAIPRPLQLLLILYPLLPSPALLQFVKVPLRLLLYLPAQAALLLILSPIKSAVVETRR
jgi:hypothetical protein